MQLQVENPFRDDQSRHLHHGRESKLWNHHCSVHIYHPHGVVESGMGCGVHGHHGRFL